MLPAVWDLSFLRWCAELLYIVETDPFRQLQFTVDGGFEILGLDVSHASLDVGATLLLGCALRLGAFLLLVWKTRRWSSATGRYGAA